MMFTRIKRFMTATLRRRLLTGIVLIVGVMMALLVLDLTLRQSVVMQEQQRIHGVELARSLSKSSAVWVASQDLSGLQEVIDHVSDNSDLRYAMVLDRQGQVIAHMERQRRGQYLADLPQLATLKISGRPTELLDIISPVTLGDQHIGWVRLGLNGSSVASEIAQARRSGLIYSVIALLLGAGFAVMSSRYMARRLRALGAVASAARLEKFDQRAAEDGDDETAELGRDFNHMLDRLMQQDKELKASEAMFRTLFEIVPQGVVLYDASGAVKSANPAALNILHMSLADLKENPTVNLQGNYIREDGSDFPVTELPIARTLHTGLAVTNVLVGIRWQPDACTWLLVSTVPSIKAGSLSLVYATFQDITERQCMQEEVRLLAFYDALTKLPNRRLLFDRLSQAISASKRNNSHGALMVLDLDNFKPLNDTHGHLVGDLLLMEVARRLNACVRQSDTVARFGGDEFVVMLSDLEGDHGHCVAFALKVAEKIRATLAETYLLQNNSDGTRTTVEHHCSASIGLYVFYRDDDSASDIIKRADAAMYQAKDLGRNRVHLLGAPSGPS